MPDQNERLSPSGGRDQFGRTPAELRDDAELMADLADLLDEGAERLDRGRPAGGRTAGPRFVQRLRVSATTARALAARDEQFADELSSVVAYVVSSDNA